MLKLVSRPLVVALLLAAGVPTSVMAQFPGDVFFSAPSVAIPAGDAGTMTLQTFAGTLPVGAVQLQIRFNPDELEVVDVQPSAQFDTAGAFVSRLDVGKLDILLGNRTRLDGPIGTVDLATVTFRPLAPQGSVLQVALDRLAYLGTDLSENRDGSAFGGEVVVADAGSQRKAPAGAGAALKLTANDPLAVRVTRLRPAGHVVQLMVLDGSGRARSTLVQAPTSTLRDQVE